MIPTNYKSVLNLMETQLAVKEVKDTFEHALASQLSLIRVSAPLFVPRSSGLNDALSGREQAVSFNATSIENETLEIVHSLAKWKRYALGRYSIPVNTGVYTDMNAIRKEETLDELHSIYVDQWDWEVCIETHQRKLEFLKQTVRCIYQALKDTQKHLHSCYPKLSNQLADDITFITTDELLKQYPHLSSKERENAAAKHYGSIFLMKIGGLMENGEAHDLRAPDYDDWELNGDLIVYHPTLDIGVELSSMGIRVDKTSMLKQLNERSISEDNYRMYHQMILDESLPLSMGGGIGQSRICMILLEKAHIGEVQASIWDEKTIKECQEKGIVLL